MRAERDVQNILAYQGNTDTFCVTILDFNLLRVLNIVYVLLGISPA
jgi:hypothetical protein